MGYEFPIHTFLGQVLGDFVSGYAHHLNQMITFRHLELEANFWPF